MNPGRIWTAILQNFHLMGFELRFQDFSLIQ
jgi:hypothetical protein